MAFFRPTSAKINNIQNCIEYMHFCPQKNTMQKSFFNLTLLAHDFCNFIKVSNLNKKSAFNIIANLQKACQASIPFNAVVRHWIKLFLVQILHFKTTMVQKQKKQTKVAICVKPMIHKVHK